MSGARRDTFFRPFLLEICRPIVYNKWFSSILCGLYRRDQETVVATIEGLAFSNRSSREPLGAEAV
jgi:hypothetical protein